MVASSTFLPISAGTVTWGGPLLTEMVTVSPLWALVSPLGFCSKTVPAAASFSALTTLTLKPAAFRADVASSWLLPNTAGTVTWAADEDPRPNSWARRKRPPARRASRATSRTT